MEYFHSELWSWENGLCFIGTMWEAGSTLSKQTNGLPLTLGKAGLRKSTAQLNNDGWWALFSPVRCDLYSNVLLFLCRQVQMHFIIRTMISVPVSGCCGNGSKVLYSGCVCTYTPPTMHHHGDQVVEPLRIGGVPGGVEEAELQGEDPFWGVGDCCKSMLVTAPFSAALQGRQVWLFSH